MTMPQGQNLLHSLPYTLASDFSQQFAGIRRELFGLSSKNCPYSSKIISPLPATRCLMSSYTVKEPQRVSRAPSWSSTHKETLENNEVLTAVLWYRLQCSDQVMHRCVSSFPRREQDEATQTNPEQQSSFESILEITFPRKGTFKSTSHGYRR